MFAVTRANLTPRACSRGVVGCVGLSPLAKHSHAVRVGGGGCVSFVRFVRKFDRVDTSTRGSGRNAVNAATLSVRVPRGTTEVFTRRREACPERRRRRVEGARRRRRPNGPKRS